MSDYFNRKTFTYLGEAGRNKKNRKWFAANKSLYEEEAFFGSRGRIGLSELDPRYGRHL
jgi:hypothetical protein